MRKIQLRVRSWHLKLLSRMSFRFDDDIEWGGAAADFKRPYGSGNLYEDMIEIMGLGVDKDDDGDLDLTREQLDILYRIHKEMASVVQILVQHRGIEEGVYESDYGFKWNKVN